VYLLDELLKYNTVTVQVMLCGVCCVFSRLWCISSNYRHISQEKVVYRLSVLVCAFIHCICQLVCLL